MVTSPSWGIVGSGVPGRPPRLPRRHVVARRRRARSLSRRPDPGVGSSWSQDPAQSAVRQSRQTRRWAATDIVQAGIPRTRNEVAAVRAALWAVLGPAGDVSPHPGRPAGHRHGRPIGRELLRIRRHKRRSLLHAVVNDLLDGARALGELEVARELRRRGLPTPERQVLRKDARNRYYLDLYWPRFHLVVEIDGIHHAWAENVVGDALRQNALTLDGDTVLRLPLLGLPALPRRVLRPDQAGPRGRRHAQLRRDRREVIRKEQGLGTYPYDLPLGVGQSKISLSQLSFFFLR